MASQFFLWQVLIAACAIAPSESSPLETAVAVCNAFHANRSLVTHGIVKYRYFTGHESDLKRALAGTWRERSEASCLFAFDARHARYDRVYPVSVLAAHTRKEGHQISTSLHPIRVLANGDSSLIDNQFLSDDDKSLVHRVQIEAGKELLEKEGFDLIATLGRGPVPVSELYALEQAVARQGNYRLVSAEEDRLEDGTPTIHLSVDAPDYDKPEYDDRIDFWVDLEHGAIPRRVRLTRLGQKKGIDITEYSDVHLLGNGAWLPYHWIDITYYGKAMEYQVDHADFDKPTNASVFRLEFETPVPVLDTVKGVRYAPQSAWDLDRLPGSGSVNAQRIAIEEPSPPPPPETGPVKPWGWEVYLPAAIGVGLIAVVVYRTVRARARSARIRK